MNYHSVNYYSSVHIGRLYEVREYLFSIGCLFYSLELALAQGQFAAISRVPFTGLKLAGRRIPFWLMICSLVIAGSVGLMFFQHFKAMAKTDIREEAYRSITAGRPVVRSSFNVYLIENELTYVKEPCAPADTWPLFFLHIMPADANDLPDKRKQHGYDNLDFSFGWRDGWRKGRHVDGKCLVATQLPDYKITSIRTGQYIPEAGQIWKAEFPVGAMEDGQGR